MSGTSATAAPPQQRPVAELNGVDAGYGGRPALRDASLQAHGGIVALVGPNGSGKSTLLRVLATLHRPSSGTVLVADHQLDSRASISAARAQVGYLGQEPQFPDSYTVDEALTYAAWLHRVPRRDRAGRVADVVGQLDLSRYASARLRELSSGTKQRVLLGQALIHRPALLLLDEPTTGVDVVHRSELRTVLKDLAARGTAVVMSSHLVDDLERLADRVVLLVEGTVRFDGTVDELAAHADGHADSSEHPIERAMQILTSTP